MPLFRSEKKEHYWVYEQLTGQEVSAKYDTWAADYDQQLAQGVSQSAYRCDTYRTASCPGRQHFGCRLWDGVIRKGFTGIRHSASYWDRYFGSLIETCQADRDIRTLAASRSVSTVSPVHNRCLCRPELRWGARLFTPD